VEQKVFDGDHYSGLEYAENAGPYDVFWKTTVIG
jgi:hypothetical protein